MCIRDRGKPPATQPPPTSPPISPPTTQPPTTRPPQTTRPSTTARPSRTTEESAATAAGSLPTAAAQPSASIRPAINPNPEQGPRLWLFLLPGALLVIAGGTAAVSYTHLPDLGHASRRGGDRRQIHGLDGVDNHQIRRFLPHTADDRVHIGFTQTYRLSFSTPSLSARILICRSDSSPET